MGPAGLTEAEWAALSLAEQDEWAAYQEDLSGGESLRDFMVRMTPHHPPPAHLDPLLELLEEARVNRLMKVGVSMPPGHGKTTLFLNAFAWWLTKFPADTCAYNSFSTTAAFSKSVEARRLAARAGVELSEDTNNKAEWRTEEGGGLLAGGMASLTGKRVQGPLVIDDPYSGRVDAYSPAYREEVWGNLMTVAMTRREGAPLFVVHTRWAEDDAIGRLKRLSHEGKIDGWRFVNLQALDPHGKALWPGMYPAEDLLTTKRDIGEFDFAALYQGEPRPRGGAVFGAPHYYDPDEVALEGCRLVLAGDPAASTRTSADYSAAVVLAITGDGVQRKAYVLHVHRVQVPIPQFARDLRRLQDEYGGTAINIEAVGAFKAIPQMLLDIEPDLRINEVPVLGDKFTRAQPVAAAWNDGRLLVPANSKRIPGDAETKRLPPPRWLGPFLDEVGMFTGVSDKHDDQVDALAHAWNSEAGPSMWDVL